MTIKKFLKDNYSFFIYNLTFMLLITLTLVFSPIEYVFSDTIMYISLIDIVLTTTYLCLKYLNKKVFINKLKDGIDNNNFNELTIFKSNEEEKFYLNLLREYQDSSNKILNDNKKELEENKDMINLWVHDVKIPISIIKLIIEENEDEELEKVLEGINTEVFRIENALERVLYFSRLDSFHKDFFIQDVNLERIVKDVVKKYSTYFINKKVCLKLENLDYTVLSDKKWLTFILEQIVGNSLKYISSNNDISITCKKTKNYLQLKVEDHGCGIKKEDLSRIFDKGFTGNNGRYNAKSTGLGLYLVKELSDKLKHDIKVESEYGKYTLFTIEFNVNM
ncbi:ATP-binding protein [Metaclostridioides mangenotii]|uniref:ATP-binding protein n=1 Tax=Metaclostridioides mangenotii TaxID=1540 RepID=UPI0028EC483C|nr:ATP-binding protein [Clostridioides mangenotii]